MTSQHYNNKSYVSMEQRQCIVCGINYDTNSILLDKRLRDSMERYTVTGTGLCPEHEKLHKDGYIALVECDPVKSQPANGIMKPENAYRTGVLLHMRRTVAREVFNVEIPDTMPMMFIDPDVTAKIKGMMPDGDGKEE